MTKPLSILVLGVLACGGGGGNTDSPARDAAVADAEIDAAPPSPTSIRVILRMQDNPFPSGYLVLFQRPDDSVIAAVMTDSKGIAETMVTGPTTVSLLAPGPNNSKTMFVYLGAKAGDVLEIGPALTPETKSVGGMVTLQLPPTTGSFTVSSRCAGTVNGSGGATPTIQLTPCGTPTNFYVNSGAGHFYTPLLALTAGQTVDLTGETYRTTTSHVIQLTNAPPTPQNRAFLEAGASDYGYTLTVADDRNVAVTGGNALATYTMNDNPNVPYTSEVTVIPTDGVISWRRRLPPGDQFFDWSLVNIPYVSARTYANGMLSWTETGGGTGAEYSAANIVVRNAGVTRLNISLAGPHTAASLRMPVYPADYADFNPKAGDTTFSITGYIARSTGGWDRARPFVHRFDFTSSMDWLGQGEQVWTR